MLRLRIPLFLALVASVGLASCDNDDLDDSDVRVVNFTMDGDDFDINGDGDIASYVLETRALSRSVVDDGIVLLYAEGDLFISGDSDTWTALPYTEGIEAVDSDGIPYVDFTLTYSYSYGVDFLYFDIVSSALDESGELLDGFIPGRVRMKLVTIPGGGFARGIDYSDYESVKQAYNLPD